MKAMQANGLMLEQQIIEGSFELCSQDFDRRLSLRSRLLSASSLERSDRGLEGLVAARAGLPERRDAGRKRFKGKRICKRFGA
jgi:hypothetical protein